MVPVKLLSLVLVAFFLLVSAIYAASLGVNDAGFLLSFVIGAAGAVLVFFAEMRTGLRFPGAKGIGYGLLGLSIFLTVANLYMVPLVV